MKSFRYFFAFALLGLTLSACSSGSSSSSTTSALTTIDSLPASTAPVEDGANANLTSRALMRHLGTSTDGMPLGELSESDFSGKSQAACEMYNMTKQAINQAAMADLIFCYISTTFDSFAEAENIDIYDGEYHVFGMDFTGSTFEEAGDSGPDKIRFKVVKNSAGVVTQFEMFACQDGTQNEYLNQVIDGTEFSSESIHIGEGGMGESFSDHATVTARLNSEGAFVDEVDGTPTPKVIHMRHSGESENFDFWGDMTFSQYSDAATMTGTMSGSNTFDSHDCTFENIISGSVSLVDTNADGAIYDIGALELGDGAVHGEVSGGCTGFGSFTDEFTDAWDGGTAVALGDPTESAYYDDVADDTLTAATEPTIEFSGSSAYDCSDDAEAIVVFADLGVDVEASCSNLQLGHEHIDCWHVAGEGADDF